MANSNYSIDTLRYDRNGNILQLKRQGVGGLIDNLGYTYDGNQLRKVSDSGTTAGFKDGTNTDDDYGYWANGALKYDKNKGIDSIVYHSYLNKVSRVKFTNGNWINFYYDGTGKLLKRKLSNGDEWQYRDDILFKNGNVYQINHDEGRVVYDSTAQKWVLEYDYRDHQGNLRLSFRDSLAAPVNGIYAPPVVTQITEQDPMGFPLSSLNYSRKNKNNFGFLNREMIAETGWIDLNNRFYMPDLMRFGQTDPITQNQENYSLYQYSWNNPINKSDPNGDFCIPCATAVVGAVVGAGLNAYDQHKAGTLSFSAKSIGRIAAAGAVGAIAGSGLGGVTGAALASAGGEALDQVISSGTVNNFSKVVINGAAAGVAGGLVKGAEAVAIKSGIVAIAKRTISANSTTKIVTSVGKSALNSSSRSNVSNAEATTKSVVEGVSGVASYVGGNKAANVLTPPISPPVKQPVQPVPPANKPNEPQKNQ